MSGDVAPVNSERATRDAVTASVEAAFHFLSEDEESLEVQKREFAEEVAKVRADAAEAAATDWTEAAHILRAARLSARRWTRRRPR
jgi:hypothetical protein